MPSVLRSLVIPLGSELPVALLSLLKSYRLLVNEILREALVKGRTSHGSLSRFARDRARFHQFTGMHAVAASGIALSLVKGHRRRLRAGSPAAVPFVRRLFLRTTRETFHLDLTTGKLRLSLRNGIWCSFFLQLSKYHFDQLTAQGVRIKQLHLTPERVVLFLERPAPLPFNPTSLLALDTNMASLDGVSVSPNVTRPVRVGFAEISAIQQRHFSRRRHLARTKATDRRVGRRVLSREGMRERHGVRSQLHLLSRRLVLAAERARSAIALENLSGLPRLRRRSRSSPRFRRRLSSWPRRELHRQIEYKAAERGVPVYWVNPFRTSITCPACGEITRPRRRVEPMFVCGSCGWKLDRQLNAGVNIGRTVLRDYGRAELGGLRLALDALSNEAMRPLYPFEESDGHGQSGGSGRDEVGRPG